MSLSRPRAAAESPKFYDVQAAADLFHMSRMTVYRAIKDGSLHAIRIRGRWLIPARVIDELAASTGE